MGQCMAVWPYGLYGLYAAICGLVYSGAHVAVLAVPPSLHLDSISAMEAVTGAGTALAILNSGNSCEVATPQRARPRF